MCDHQLTYVFNATKQFNTQRTNKFFFYKFKTRLHINPNRFQVGTTTLTYEI